MRREELNPQLDAFLAVYTSTRKAPNDLEKARGDLIDLAIDSDDFLELLASWLWFLGQGLESALSVKIWFGLSYRDLSELYGLSFREIGQNLRAQRIRLLGAYPPLGQEKVEIEGVSCFMMEQRLSEWMDSEWEDFSGLSALQAHLDQCQACQARRSEYRNLQEAILKKREVQAPLSTKEWRICVEKRSNRKRRLVFQWGLALLIFLSSVSGGVWLYSKRTEKTPNVYEIMGSE